MADKPSILVIDDDDVTLRLLSVLLKSWGFKARMAGGGREGLKAAAQERFDLIILDVYMPEVDGWETLARLRNQKITERTPVLLLTSADQLKNAEKALQLGANGYLSKPLDPVLFNKKVSELLRNGMENQSGVV